MNEIKKFFTGGIAVLTVVILTWSPAIAAQTFKSTPITLKTADLIPPSIMQGSNYKLADTIHNNGIFNTYQIDTDYGLFFAESTPELLNIINDLNALANMQKLSRLDTFNNSMVSGVKAPFKLVGNIATSPVESTKNIVKGTGGFLSNLGRSVYSSDPHQANIFKVALGYDTARRAFAYEFLINPYTTFEPTEERLGEIARAAVAGGIVPRAAIVTVGGVVGTSLALSATAKSMKKLVRDNPPGALAKINRDKLLAMDVTPEIIKAFFSNDNYDPETRTILIGELETMKDVSGRSFFIAAATLAVENTTAQLYKVTAKMMAEYHHKIAPAVEIGVISGSPFIKNKENFVVLPLAADYIFWTEAVSIRLAALEQDLGRIKDVKGKEIWVLGSIDTEAKTQLENHGWTIFQNLN